MKCSLCTFLQLPFALFSDTPNLCSSVGMRGHISHRCSVTCKIIDSYILTCTFLVKWMEWPMIQNKVVANILDI
jgi:hypothetical protein